MDYDVMVVGGGIGGMESSLKLGDMGYKVLLVEKEPSVGGRMILLSKVFPTLDCASCISGPKMSSTMNHPNVTVAGSSEVREILPQPDGSFRATITRHATYVDWAACTGCQECEPVCPVAVPDQFNSDLVARRAVYLAFPQAVPKKVVIERAGTSPCSDECPAGIKAHGYVALAREGRYEEGFQLVLEATPLVGTLGRACYAPCEDGCTRGEVEGSVPIRAIKRFLADRHYAQDDTPGVTVPEPNGRRVAVVGSGPAGLTAAWQLALRGYEVTILEADDEPGGFLRYALPTYRLPREVVERDIQNVRDVGVTILTGARVEDPVELTTRGFDGVIVATGTPVATPMGVPGEDAAGVVSGLDFLRDIRLGRDSSLEGRRVAVVGGGNVAMDAARSALRRGAASVTIVYRRGRDEMPAHPEELEGAQADGVALRLLLSPLEVLTDEHGAARALRCATMRLGEPDASGRRAPEPVPGAEEVVETDLVIAAVGMAPDVAGLASVLATSRGRLSADPLTLQTSVPSVFAAGDVVAGASDITRAAGAGRRAALNLDRYLRGEPLGGVEALDGRLERVETARVLARQSTLSPHAKVERGRSEASGGFAEIERTLREDEVRAGASACLDCGVCSECGSCARACPADAIDFTQRDRDEEVRVGAVVLSTGFTLFPADLKPEYGWGVYPNVITGMQMDRLIAPTRPFNTILRPSDGKVPERIGYVSCTGSRDHTVGNPRCSKICCMYSIKQNQLIMGTLPLADVTMHYIDIRAAGKRYEEFYQQSRDMGAQYIKGRVASITETPEQNLIVRYEDIDHGGRITEAEYDLVVLAVGVMPNPAAAHLFPDHVLALDEAAFVAEPDGDLQPGRTNIPGVFVAGAASGPKDIVDSIAHAGAAVAGVAAYLQSQRAATAILEEVGR